MAIEASAFGKEEQLISSAFSFYRCQTSCCVQCDEWEIPVWLTHDAFYVGEASHSDKISLIRSISFLSGRDIDRQWNDCVHFV